jgi:truncated hemoglobin YjbI
MTNLYQNIGGKKTIDIIVDNFYNILSNDNRVNHLLNDIDLESQKIRTFLFLTKSMREKVTYNQPLSNKYITPDKLTEEELAVFEEVWINVLLEMDLTILLPLVRQGIAVSKCLKKRLESND